MMKFLSSSSYVLSMFLVWLFLSCCCNLLCANASLALEAEDDESSPILLSSSFQDDFYHLVWEKRSSLMESVVSGISSLSSSTTPVNEEDEEENKNRSSSYTLSLKRHLAVGDWDDFNALFRTAQILLPDTSVSANLLFRLDMNLQNIRCTELGVGDIVLTWNRDSSSQVTVGLELVDLDLTCFLDYDYYYGGFAGGSGSAEAYTDNNDAQTTLTFRTASGKNFDNAPPATSTIDQCIADINISDLRFRGGFVAAILDTFEGLIRGTITGEVQGVICNELSNLDLSELLAMLNDLITPYLSDSAVNDVLELERSLNVPDNVLLYDLSNTNDSIGAWFDTALDQIDALLGEVVDDPNAPDGSGQSLGINQVLRDFVLEEDRSLNIDMEALGIDGTLYEGHDPLTETKIILKAARVYGLDTFTTFEALNAVGNYTLQNTLALDNLVVEVELIIEMRASTKPDSIIVQPDENALVREEIVVDFGIDDIDADIAFLLAVDSIALGRLPLGPLLNTNTILGCLLTTVFEVGIAGFDVSVGSVRDPVLDGFVSKGIDRLVTDGVEIAFLMYEAVFLKALPNVFDTFAIDFLNNDLIGPLLGDASCPEPNFSASGGVIDFRDLLLAPSEAAEWGASGTEPYGDIGHTLMSLVNGQLFAPGEDGLPKINDVLIAPLTEGQSGSRGALRFPGIIFQAVKNLLNITRELALSICQKFEISGMALRVENLDVFTLPMYLLEVTDPEDGTVLSNVMNVGPVADRDLTAAMQVLWEIGGPGSPLYMLNIFDITLTIPHAILTATLQARVDEERLSNFPVKDVLDYNCWLSTFVPVSLDEEGRRANEAELSPVFIRDFFVDLLDFALNVECVQCTSQSASDLLPDILRIMRETGAVTYFRGRLDLLLEQFFTSDWVQLKVDQLISTAPALCPSHPAFDETAIRPEYVVDFPEIEKDWVETAVFAAGMAAGLTLVPFVESHSRKFITPTNPFSAQDALIPEEGENLVDWGNLTGSLGSFASSALDEIRNYLNGENLLSNEDNVSDFGFNELLNDFLLDEDGNLLVEFDDLGFDTYDFFKVYLAGLRITGLSSAKSVNLLQPLRDQTMRNTIVWDHIGVELILTVQVDAEVGLEELVVRFEFNDIEIDAFALLAFDYVKIAKIAVGSVLQGDETFHCMISALKAFEATQLDARVGSVSTPTISGYFSPEVEAQFNKTADEIFSAYQRSLVDGFPLVISDTGRKLLNILMNKYFTIDNNNICPPPPISSDPNAVIDFRDLLLSATSALEAGTSGASPYGGMGAVLKDLLDDELLTVKPGMDRPAFNSAIIRPLTKEQSGVEGRIALEGNLVTIGSGEIEQFGIDEIGVSMANVIFENLDTIGAPLELLDANETNGQLFDNRIIVGAGERPFKVSVNIVLEVDGDPMFEMRNDMKIGVDLRMADMEAVVMARLGESSFMEFPLQDIMNADCWMATLATPVLDEDGKRLVGMDPALAIDFLELVVGSMDLSLECVECSSPGLKSLQEVIDTLNEGGVVENVQPFLVDFTVELLQTEYVQTMLDRFVDSADRRCPHSPGFVSENATRPTYPSSGFPGLTADGVESAVYAGTVVVQSAAVLLAKAYENEGQIIPTPLSAQEAFNATDNLILDFQQLNSTIGQWVDSAIDEANSYLNSIVTDTFGPDGRDLGINKLLRGAFLDENRALSIEFEPLSFGDGGFVASLSRITIKGFDSFTAFNAFDAIAPQTFRNSFSWRELGIELVVNVQEEGQEPEEMIVSFGLEDIISTITIFFAIDQDDLGSMEFGSLFETSEILPCILSTSKGAEVTELDVMAGGIKGVSVNGFVSEEVNTDIDEATKVLMDEYMTDILLALPHIFDKPVRTLANNWITYYLNQEASVTCALSVLSRGVDGHVDFRDLLLPAEEARELGGSGQSQYGNLFRSLKDLVTTEVLNKNETDSPESSVNSMLIAPFTEFQSGDTGTYAFEQDLFKTNTPIDIGGFDAVVKLEATDFRIENLDTVGQPLSVLDPVDGVANNLNNTAAFGVAERPLRLALRFMISVEDGEDVNLRNEVEVGLDLDNAWILLEAMLKINERDLMEFPLRDIQNLHCWLSTLSAPELDSRGLPLDFSASTTAIEQLIITLADINLSVRCISCTSPGMDEFVQLLSTEEAQDGVEEVANTLLDYGLTLVRGKYMQVQIDRYLNIARKKCPHRAEYDPNFGKAEYDDFESVEGREENIVFLLTLIAATAGVILAVAFVMIVIKCFVRRRSRKWLGRLADQKIVILSRLQKVEDAKETELNRQTTSMFISPQIPWYVRYCIPIVILGNVGFFLSGHLSLGGSVRIDVSLAGEQIIIDDFFQFSIAKSTLDIWRAGGRELAIFILIFSGIWPYTKQFITLFLWFLPPRLVSTSTRGSIFLWLDALGKYSFVDIFVLVLSIAAFMISIDSPEVSFLPKDFYFVKMFVVPMWGLYANMIAQLISQVSSHFIIHYHRRIVEVASASIDRRITGGGLHSMDSDDEDSDVDRYIGRPDPVRQERTVLANQSFARPHRGESDKLVVRRSLAKLPILIGLVMTVLIVVGCFLPSFSLELLGMIGLAVESGQRFEQAKVYHSIFSVVEMLMNEASYLGGVGDYLGLGAFSIVYVATVMVVPVAQGIGLAIAWLYPLTPRQRNRTAVFIETMQAWQYVEVYLFALIVSTWQLGPVSEFMIEPYCDSLKNAFANFVYYDIIVADDALCFKVDARIEDATYILIAGAALLIFLNTFVMKAVVQHLRDNSAPAQTLENPKYMHDPMNDAAIDDARRTLKPNPVLFTDTFRWLLIREDGRARSMLRRISTMVSRSKESDEESFLDDERDQASDSDSDGTQVRGPIADPEIASVNSSVGLYRVPSDDGSVEVSSLVSASESNEDQGRIHVMPVSGDEDFLRDPKEFANRIKLFFQGKGKADDGGDVASVASTAASAKPGAYA